MRRLIPAPVVTAAATLKAPARAVANVSVFVAVFMALLFFPWPYHDRLLDDGWSLALAHFMGVRARAGVDYVFTYGPLGYLAVPALIPGLFTLKYLWSILVAAASTLAIWRAADLFPTARLRAGWLWLAVLFLPRTENRFVFVLVLIGVVLVLEDTWSRTWLVATSLFFAATALVKFTFFVLTTLVVAILCGAAPRRARVFLAASYVLSLGSLWLACGQSLVDLPRYLMSSFEIAAGYSEAMSVEGSATHLALACLAGILAVLGVGLSGPWRGASSALPAQRVLPVLGMFALGAVLSWKESFVRQDASRAVAFFGYLALASVLCLAIASSQRERMRRIGRAALFAVPLLSVGVAARVENASPARFLFRAQTWSDARDSASILLAPHSYLARSTPAVRAGAGEWTLPETARRIGNARVDVVTNDQAVAIYNAMYNGFNYRPRPVFQSYSAYTPALAERNAEFFRGARAPKYVLSRWTTIDARYPAADDAPILMELLTHYRPVLSERDYLVLERDPASDDGRDAEEHLLDVRAKRGQRIALPTANTDGLYTISLGIHETLAARSLRILFRGRRLPFVIELEGGVQKRYELVPSVASVPFLVSPALEASDDLARIYEGHGKRVVAVLVPKDMPDSLHYFEDDLEIRVVRYPRRLAAMRAPNRAR